MQLYKRRNFGMLISDTFAFLKENGKNYFKNYLLLNGPIITILVAMYILGYRSVFAQAFDANLNGNSFYFEEYFQESSFAFGLLFAVFIFLFFSCILVISTYPVMYMKRYGEARGTVISINDIIGDMRANVGRFLLFLLGMSFLVMPVAFALLGISVVLIFILVGFFLMLVLVPMIMNVVNFTLFDYLHTRKGFFSSLSYAMRSQFSYSSGNLRSPFWKYVASSAVILFIIQIVSGLFSVVPLLLMYGSVLTVPTEVRTGSIGEFFNSGMGLAYFIINGIVMVVMLLLYNLIYINAGLMYYDSRIDLHRAEDFLEIDTIGKSEN